MEYSPLTLALMAVAGLLLLYWIVYLLAGGFNFRRIGLALRSDWRALRDSDFASKVEPLLTPPPPTPQTPPKPSGAPLRLLSLLQRQGRLLDFLLEDIQSYPDAQIG